MTPTPWIYIRQFNVKTDDIEYAVIAKSSDGSEVAVCTAGTEADGKLIARAVNMHGPAMEFLRWLQENSGECLGDSPKAMAMLAALIAAP